MCYFNLCCESQQQHAKCNIVYLFLLAEDPSAEETTKQGDFHFVLQWLLSLENFSTSSATLIVT